MRLAVSTARVAMGMSAFNPAIVNEGMWIVACLPRRVMRDGTAVLPTEVWKEIVTSWLRVVSDEKVKAADDTGAGRGDVPRVGKDRSVDR